MAYYLNEGYYGSFRIFLREPVPRIPIVVKVRGPCVLRPSTSVADLRGRVSGHPCSAGCHVGHGCEAWHVHICMCFLVHTW